MTEVRASNRGWWYLVGEKGGRILDLDLTEAGDAWLWGRGGLLGMADNGSGSERPDACGTWLGRRSWIQI